MFPDVFSYELFELYLPKSAWNQTDEITIATDYEDVFGRKKYASNTVGGYYAAKLALTEYLYRIKRQATALFIREVSQDYYAPLGVGILRETCRDAFSKKAERFDTLEEAFGKIQERLSLKIDVFKEKSVILKEYGKQMRLDRWY